MTPPRPLILAAAVLAAATVASCASPQAADRASAPASPAVPAPSSPTGQDSATSTPAATPAPPASASAATSAGSGALPAPPFASDPAQIAPTEGVRPFASTEAAAQTELAYAASALALGIATGNLTPAAQRWAPLTSPVSAAGQSITTQYTYGGWNTDAGTFCLDAAALEGGYGTWWHYSDESGQVVPGPCPDNGAPVTG